MADTEIWKDIEGYEGIYQVSNFGRVKSLEREYSTTRKGTYCIVHRKERIMKPQVWKHRNKIQLRNADGEIKTYRVATLVANAFVPNPENKPEIDHIIPVYMGGTDAADNLRWVTGEENRQNPLSCAINSARPVLQYDMEGNFIKKWDSAAQAGKELNIYRQHICAVCRGRKNRAGWFVWKYAS